MKNTPLLRLPALVILLCCFCAAAQAQTRTPDNSITIHVEGLTPEVRDGIRRDLEQRNDLELVYACVPAGIMVFEPRNGARGDLREAVMPALEHRIKRDRIRMENMDRNTAEQRCAQARNR